MKELHKITVSCNVKDADFYYYAMLHANKQHINGFIQNGTPNLLYLEIEGNPDSLNKFEHDFLKGYLSRNIHSVSIDKDEAVGYEIFEHRKVKHIEKEKGILRKPLKFLASFFIS
jgi:acylphosphatase